MRRTVGETAYAAFLENTREELCAVAERPGPWPSDLIHRAMATAMFLGFETLEAACRALSKMHDEALQEQARQAARTALQDFDIVVETDGFLARVSD